MRRRLLIFVFLMLIVALPAYAYGDPTGGMLFQVLTPILAMIWGLWMILANSIRRGTGKLVRRFRNLKPDDQAPPDEQAPQETN
jgi:hypothetical protein